MKKKHIIYIVSAVLIVFIAAIGTYIPHRANSQHGLPPVTVFVHGYKGTANSFGGMLNRFERNDWGNKALICYVTRQGHVKTYSLNKEEKRPILVQVVFENNRASFEDTTRWLSKVMKQLKLKYHIHSVNLVGHSMGGIVSLKYLEEYQETSRYPVTNKLITIGSPFNGIYNRYYFQINHDAATTDLKPNSAALQLLRKNAVAIPDYINVLSISSTGDPVAVPESVGKLKTMIPQSRLTEKIIDNDYLGHSELHENTQVDQMIYSFLWQD
ncbi:alpha/beta fold hydrolase [Lentibacillus sp. L22]|uniref:alpha/beta fold hydrolase n=1 Tax=Lentibacillus TaxID=175304 RepID=UPI0022B0BA34|nr:alpha/beta fold hydrolase [Lentibacillus daqui]